MEIIHQFIDIFLHLDKHLTEITSEYGTLTYVILFAIIFAETGLVVTPFLPGDSLIFAAGAISALPGGGLSFGPLFLVLLAAAILGNTVNYSIGKLIGPRAFSGKIPFLTPENLAKTEEFFAKYGGNTIIITRFVPLVRTFAPFVAGVGAMKYGRFMLYNILGGLLWVGVCIVAGYFFGNMEIVKKNFSLVVLGIIALSILPPIVEAIRSRGKKAKALAPTELKKKVNE